MDNNTVTIFNEEFENGKTGEKVQGITIIMDMLSRKIGIIMVLDKN